MASRKKRAEKSRRLAVPAAELEAKLMDLLRQDSDCAKLRGLSIVYVGSLGNEPNWFAHPVPLQVSDRCMKQFIFALGHVRRGFDLLIEWD
jgi:hypothetical protein